MGNVLGSNLVNIGLILGLSALARPVHASPSLLKRELPVMVIASALLALLSQDGILSRWDGLLLLAFLIAYIWLCIRDTVRDRGYAQSHPPPKGAAVAFLSIIAGMSILLFAAYWMVASARAMAMLMGVSERVVALTLVATGTSLPELATSLLAAARRSGDLSLGNVLGSNIFNICGIAGLAALISPIPLYSGMITRDLPAMLFLSVLVVPLSVSGQRLSRAEGGCLLAAYAALLYSLLR